MFHISSPIVLFLMAKPMTFFWRYRSNFIWGGQKEGVRRGMGEEAQSEDYFCKSFIIKKDTNFFSQTVGQTNF